MARRCELTGTTVQTGNNVSHAQNKSRRRYLPNLCNVSLTSDALRRSVRFRICAKTLRSVDHKGGLDKFLLAARDRDLSLHAQRIKREIRRKTEAAAG